MQLGKNILLGLFVSFCIVMQLLAGMPHHHHDDDQMPCKNIFHCLNEEVTPEQCDHLLNSKNSSGCCDHYTDQNGCESHSHDAGDENCGLYQLDFYHADREENITHVISVLPSLAFSTLAYCSEGDCDRCFTENIKRVQRVFEIIPLPVGQEYFVRALPVRGPFHVC